MQQHLYTTLIYSLALICLLVISAGDAQEECSCSCVKTEIPASADEQEELIEQEVEKIKEELYVHKESLSSNVRKKSSADDDRPSAQNVGYMGVAMLGLAGGLIIVMDANYLIKIGYMVFNKLPKFGGIREK